MNWIALVVVALSQHSSPVLTVCDVFEMYQALSGKQLFISATLDHGRLRSLRCPERIRIGEELWARRIEVYDIGASDRFRVDNDATSGLRHGMSFGNFTALLLERARKGDESPFPVCVFGILEARRSYEGKSGKNGQGFVGNGWGPFGTIPLLLHAARFWLAENEADACRLTTPRGGASAEGLPGMK